jgi:uncharacterized protein
MLLWQIEGTSTYLLGTIHILDRVLVLSQTAEDIYTQSAQIVFEADLSTQAETNSLLLAAGQSLRQIIPESVFGPLRQQWLAAGLPESNLDRLKPGAAGLALVFSVAAKRGFIEKHGIDKTLWTRAAQDGKKVAVLEQHRDAMKILTSASPDEQLRFLRYCIDPAQPFQIDIDQTAKATLSGAEEPLITLQQRRLDLAPQAFRALLVGRNQNWMPAITAVAKSGAPTLIAVGAFHLVGKLGIPMMLTDAGLTTTRVH